MNKKFFTTVLALMMLLSGCQLAVPGTEVENAKEADRLVGVFITTQYLELTDTETFLQDNMEAVLSGSNPDIDPQHTQKLYAAETDAGFTFAGLDGMLLASFFKILEGGTKEDGYWISQMDTGLSDVHNSFFSGDTSESITKTASIYVPLGSGETLFYFNPVYQTADGDVYVISGTGMSMNTDRSGQMSQKTSETSEYTEGGITHEYSATFEVTVESIRLPTEITLIHMDENHTELSRSSHLPGQLPESLTPDQGAAYILIEEHFEDGIRRSVNQPEDGAIEIFYKLENGLCIRSSTEVLWSNQ